VSNPNDAIVLAVVCEDAAAGRLTASIPGLPGHEQRRRTEVQANANVIDALRTTLSLEPDNIPDHATAERVRITLAVARRQACDLRVRS
jgi:hypothetical protein